MSKGLDTLAAQVARTTDLEASAVQLIQGLAAQIEAGKNDASAMQALADSLRNGTDVLSQALTANTPAAPDTSSDTSSSATS